MSALYVGAYDWSQSNFRSSSSSCEATNASGLSVGISNVPCGNCASITTSSGLYNGANSYGGSMSALYVGAYAWSISKNTDSNTNTNSTCGATIASNLSVGISNTSCTNCVASTNSTFASLGVNS
jgi:hypothetical protein